MVGAFQRKEHKLTSKWSWTRPSDPISTFWDPLIIIERIKLSASYLVHKQAVREAHTICPRPCKLTFDLFTVNDVVTLATPVPILVFLGLSVLDLGLMYTTYR